MAQGGPIPTQFQRDFSNAEGTFPSGAAVSPGSRFSLTGDASQPAEISRGREIDPTEDAQQAYSQAQGRSALLRTLALKSPQGALSKLAPIIGQAEQEEAAALQNLQLTQDRQAVSEQAIAKVMAETAASQREQAFRASEGKKNRASQEESARIRAQGPLGAVMGEGGAPAPEQASTAPPTMGAAMFAPPQAQAPAPPQSVAGAEGAAAGALGQPDELDQLFSVEDPAELESILGQVDWAQVQSNPKATQLAQARLMQLLQAGVPDEEIVARYANLYRLGGGQ